MNIYLCYGDYVAVLRQWERALHGRYCRYTTILYNFKVCYHHRKYENRSLQFQHFRLEKYTLFIPTPFRHISGGCMIDGNAYNIKIDEMKLVYQTMNIVTVNTKLSMRFITATIKINDCVR